MPTAEPARRTRTEYAPLGLIGALTPEANTTVEPEFNVLLPVGFACLNARLTSAADGIEARLRDYGRDLERQCAQFGNAPLDALALAVTGASYLMSIAEEDALVDRLLGRRGVPLVTAARAVCDALDVLEAKRIALLSPYPPTLTEASVKYWQARGFEVGRVQCTYRDTDAFHPIYSLDAETTGGALERLRDARADAVVMLGTGLPTLRPIAERAHWGGPPVVSSMLCLAWRSWLAAQGAVPAVASLRAWLAGRHWRMRLPLR